MTVPNINFEGDFSTYVFFRKVKYIWKSHFSEVISTIMLIGNDFLVFKYRLRVNKDIQNLYIFIDIKVTVWLLCAHPLMTSKILHTWRPNSIKRQLRNWFMCFSWCSYFAFWGAEKHVFHFASFRTTMYVLHCFRCLEISNRVTNRNKVKNLIFVGSILQISEWEIPIFK